MTQKYRQISCISIGVDTLGLTGLSVTILLHERIRSINLKEHFVHSFSFLKVLNRILPFGATCSSSSSSSSLSLSLSHWWLDVRGPLQLGQASSLLLCRGGELARLVACVLHLKLSGVAGEEDFGSWFSSWSLLCFILMCCLSPFSETLV